MQIFTVGQQVLFELQGTNLRLVISALLVGQGGDNRDITRGYLQDKTAFIFTNSGGVGFDQQGAHDAYHASARSNMPIGAA